MEAWSRKVDDAHSIQRHFQDAFGCVLKLEWVQRWQRERGNAANSTLEDALRAVLSQDLRDCVERGSLQGAGLEDVKGRLEARYLVQVVQERRRERGRKPVVCRCSFNVRACVCWACR